MQLGLPRLGAFTLQGTSEDFLEGKHHNHNCFYKTTVSVIGVEEKSR